MVGRLPWLTCCLKASVIVCVWAINFWNWRKSCCRDMLKWNYGLLCAYSFLNTWLYWDRKDIHCCGPWWFTTFITNSIPILGLHIQFTHLQLIIGSRALYHSLNMTLQTSEYVNPYWRLYLHENYSIASPPPHISEVLVYLARPSGFRPCIIDGRFYIIISLSLGSPRNW